MREALAQAGDDRARLVDRERRLRDVGELALVVDLERVDVGLGLDQHDVVGRLAHRALDLLVAGVADQDDRVVLGGELQRLAVDLGHQRARRVDRLQLPALGVRVHRRRDAVGGEDGDRALGDRVVELVDEDRAALAQGLDDVLVVHDLLAHVDRRAVQLERALDGLDGAVDARAVAARSGEQEFLGRVHQPPMVDAAMLDRALRHAEAFLASLPDRPVGPPVDPDALRAALGHELTDEGVPAEQVIDELVAGADPGIVASAGPRYFGFVTGGALPAALAADWLAAAWDQNAHMWVGSPAAAVVEEVVEDWVLSLLGLPRDASVGLVTGAQMANVTCLAVARDAVLERAGWDVAGQGLIGAPPLTVIAGEEAHATIFTALRLIGLGRDARTSCAVDDQGAIDPDALARALATRARRSCARRRATSTRGAFDPLEPIEYLCEQAGAWLHVDGAFGLWAAASPAATGTSRAASSAPTPGPRTRHKWLNVPYDCGLAIVADRAAHRRAMSLSAAYLVAGEQRDNYDYTPEASRRARGFPLYAALRSLGRRGLAELIERNCAQARRFARSSRTAARRSSTTSCSTRCSSPRRPSAVARIQADGTCWVGGTVWRGREAIRISVLALGDDRRRRGAICARDPRRARRHQGVNSEHRGGGAVREWIALRIRPSGVRAACPRDRVQGDRQGTGHGDSG